MRPNTAAAELALPIAETPHLNANFLHLIARAAVDPVRTFFEGQVRENIMPSLVRGLSGIEGPPTKVVGNLGPAAVNLAAVLLGEYGLQVRWDRLWL